MEGERGQAAAEFAMAAMFAMLLIFGIIDFGRAIFTYDIVTSAARLGARYAIVHGSSCTAVGCPATAADIQTFVRGQSPGVDTSQMVVTTTWKSQPATGCSATATPFMSHGCLVVINVKFTVQLATLFTYTLPMSTTSTMMISQ
ncbi:MAG: hypothetical protein NVSMB5_19640 [Candidatus Velthaea sp.]